MAIEKKLHYCWFGKKTKPELVQKCIDSWKKYANGYEIIEWNEDNFDVSLYLYAKQAYEIKKFAFVSDVARFHVLNNEGGFYLDTDVELLKPLDELLENNFFMGYSRDGLVNSGLIMGSSPNQILIEKILHYYEINPFLLRNRRPNTTTVCEIVSDILKEENIELNGNYYKNSQITLYPCEWFDPFDYKKKELYLTEKTFSIHHYMATWKTPQEVRIEKIGRFIEKIVGNKLYKKIAKTKHSWFG